MQTVNYFSNGISVVAVELTCSLIGCVINGLGLGFSPSPGCCNSGFPRKSQTKVAL